LLNVKFVAASHNQ